MKQRITVLCAVAVASAAPLSGARASQPTGRHHGAWHVVSIASLSGTDGGDASMSMAQDVEGGSLDVRWTQGYSVVVSARIADCFADDIDAADDQDFNPFYDIDVERWQRLTRAQAARRLARDFSTWLSQARLACDRPEAIDRFRMADLKRAAYDFMDRLAAFHPPPALRR